MKSAGLNLVFRALIICAALIWALLLRVQMGTVMVLLAALFYFSEKKPVVTMMGGVLLTLVQFPAPIGMLFVHWYDGEKPMGSGKLLAVLYPVQLLVFGVLERLI